MTMSNRPKTSSQKEGYQPRETAIVETKRGAGDPTYLYYTLGKLEIMKLRADLKKKTRRLLLAPEIPRRIPQAGFPPIPIARRLPARRQLTRALTMPARVYIFVHRHRPRLRPLVRPRPLEEEPSVPIDSSVLWTNGWGLHEIQRFKFIRPET